MPEPRLLDLKDSRGEPLRHAYLCQEGAPEGLFFRLPGDNYGVDGPLLYLPARMLFSAGWDTMSVTYGYQSAGESFNPMQIPTVVDECATALQEVMGERSYPRVVLAGKSLGAAVIAVLCTMIDGLEEVRTAYLTPPLGTPVFDPVFLETEQKAYLAISTADRFYNQHAFEGLQSKRDFMYTLVSAADHSMYVEGDLDATIEVHRRVIQDMLAFALDGLKDDDSTK